MVSASITMTLWIHCAYICHIALESQYHAPYCPHRQLEGSLSFACTLIPLFCLCSRGHCAIWGKNCSQVCLIPSLQGQLGKMELAQRLWNTFIWLYRQCWPWRCPAGMKHLQQGNMALGHPLSCCNADIPDKIKELLDNKAADGVGGVYYCNVIGASLWFTAQVNTAWWDLNAGRILGLILLFITHWCCPAWPWSIFILI